MTIIKLVTIALLAFIFIGCNAHKPTVLVPEYNPEQKSVKIDNLVFDKVISYNKKIDKKIKKSSNGLLNKEKYSILLDNPQCNKLNYHYDYVHITNPNRDGGLSNNTLSNINTSDYIEKIGQVYFIHQPKNPNSQYFIYSHKSNKEYSTISLNKECFNSIKAHLLSKNKQKKQTLEQLKNLDIYTEYKGKLNSKEGQCSPNTKISLSQSYRNKTLTSRYLIGSNEEYGVLLTQENDNILGKTSKDNLTFNIQHQNNQYSGKFSNNSCSGTLTLKKQSKAISLQE